MNARRLGLAISCVVLGVLAVTGSSAQAAFTHQYLSKVTGFESPTAVAVGGSGEVYVADAATKTVDRFSSTGVPLPFSASGSYPYIDGSQLAGTPTGTPEELRAFDAPTGVAVDDESGDVYVADGLANVVDVFSSAGTYLSQLTGFSYPNGLAVDQVNHNLYVVEMPHPEIHGGTYRGRTNSVVKVISPSGGPISQFQIEINYVASLAVNGLTENLYTANLGPDFVELYDPLGRFATWNGNRTPQRQFGSPGTYPYVIGLAVAVDPTTQQVYVAQAGNGVVDEFAASISEEYEGQLTGTPSGPFTGTPSPPFSEGMSIAVSPLNQDLYVLNGKELDIFGPDINVFGTNMQEASNVTQGTATLNGHVDPAGLPVETCKFEYGTTTSYGQTAECEPSPGGIGAGSSNVNVTATATGLLPNAGYHYRLVATENKGASSETSDGTLTTAGPPQFESESATVPPGKAGQTTVTLRAGINPNQRQTTYSFEYGETEAYGASVPVPSGAFNPGEPMPPTELTGLKADTPYHYRVVASNEYGSVTGPDQQFKTEIALSLNESVSNVAATSATLEAQIDPFGNDTHYYYQYGTESCNSSSCSTVPSLSGYDLGAAETTQDTSTHLQGLQPGTVYHYRVVATNALGTTEGPDETFTTQAAGGALTLPDGRSWEMVSPPQKHGAAIEPIAEQGVIQASADGDAITYATAAPTESEPQGYSNKVQVFSSRGASGWSSLDLTPPHESATGHLIGKGLEFRAFSLDLSQGLLEPEGSFMPLSSEATEGTAYLRDTGKCSVPVTCYTPLVTVADDVAGTRFGGDVQFVGSTPDFSHIVLSSTVALTATGGGGLYEWAAGHLKFVSVLPVEEGGLPAGGNLSLGHEENARNAVSIDGSRVIWSSSNLGGSALYMWNADGAGGNGETVRLDMVQSGGVRSGHGEAVYLTASSDGSRVFFTDGERLTENSHASGSSPDLYVCEMVVVAGKLTCDLTDLTPAGVHGESAHVEEGGPGAGADGSYVYFVAESALAAGAGGGPNMYVAHEDGGKWTTSFVATLTAEDRPDWGGGGSLGRVTDRVSPNGRYLAFMSSGPLTGYDTRDAVTGQPDEEVYLYDAVSNRLVCASCNPTGARPVGAEYKLGGLRLVGGDRVWEPGDRLAANIPGWTPYEDGEALYQSRYLSDSGRLFFNSDDTLVPQDVNGNEDVYEYEPVGVPVQSQYECTTGNATYSSRSDGCVGLISSGGSPEESAFLDASENGDNVFFLTSAKLLTQDFDTSIDIYDARECSAQSPCIPRVPVSPPPCTTGDACKAAPSPQPAVYGAPSSETFSGAGNVTPTSTAISTPKTKGLSKAQRLARALKACSKKKGRRARVLCEKQARRAYGASHKVKTSQRGK